jgi:hypothetical protein
LKKSTNYEAPHYVTGGRKTIVGIRCAEERRENISERTDSLDAIWRTKEMKQNRGI